MNILQGKEILDKMIAPLSTKDRIGAILGLQEYLGVEIRDEQEILIVDIEPDETRQLTGHSYEASDYPKYKGKYYIGLPLFMTGKVESVIIGKKVYKFEFVYTDGREYWYGEPSQGVITVKFKNGATYKAAESVKATELKKFTNKEVLRWFQYTNGDRGTWYSSTNKDMREYPKIFYLTVVGCVERMEINNDGHRFPIGSPGGWPGFIVKQSDVDGRHLAVLCPQSCRSKTAYLEW